MTITNHLINSRILTTFGSLQNNLFYEDDKNYLFDLPYLGVLNVSGEKSLDFLQGQLSCDIREVTSKQVRQGAMCNLKGRVLALLDVINWDGFKLILPRDLIEQTKATLEKTAVFSKVSINVSTSHQVFGFHLKNIDDKTPFNKPLPQGQFVVLSNEQLCIYNLGDHSYILIVKNEYVNDLKKPFEETSQLRGSLAWHALQLKEMRVNIYPSSRGLFLPHRLGLHKSGYLSFNKGCYKGQEIIARTHYRAKLKHEMKLFTLEASEQIESGKILYAQNGKTEIGEVIDFCPMDQGRVLIAASVLIDQDIITF